MAQVPSAQVLLQRNKDYAEQHQPAPLMQEMMVKLQENALELPKTFIFCCFDARADPVAFLGLNPGEAIVVRTGGGAVASNLDYLISLDYLMKGAFEDVLVIQHTDCGALLLNSNDIRQDLKEKHRGTDEDIDGFKFDFDMSLEERVRSNLQLIQDCPLIRQELKDRTRGFVYDIKTGQLTEHGQTT